MRRFLQILGSLLAVGVLAFAAFAGWGGSGTLDRDALATTMRFAAPPVAVPDTFTVVTYNLGYLSGQTNNRAVARDEAVFAANLDAAAGLLERAGADIVAFQEIDFGADRSFGVDQLGELARRGGFRAAARAVNWDERYVPFPGTSPETQFGRVLSGQAVLSRFPILAHERVVLPPPSRMPGYPPGIDRLALRWYLDRLAEVVVLDVGHPLVVINVHLEAWDAATRVRQADRLRDLFQAYRADYPVLVVGDFNSLLPGTRGTDLPDWGRDDRTMATLLADGALREAFPDSVAVPTYPADMPEVKIDHILYEPADLVPVAAFVLDGPEQPSDHRAVAVRFVFRDSGDGS